MREAALEQRLRKGVLAAGGRSFKLAATVHGMPDRMVLWPGSRIELVELKTEIGRLSPGQVVWHARAAELGTMVTVLRGPAEVDAWLEERRT